MHIYINIFYTKVLLEKKNKAKTSMLFIVTFMKFKVV